MSVSGWPALRSNSVAVLALLLCCALGIGAWAAEDPERDTEELPTPTPEETDAEASPETGGAEGADDTETATRESPDIFIPTEDISESIAVKFPVDI